MLKGHTLIELTDVNTGEVQSIEDENMLTNALDYILNDNLCGHHNFPTDHPKLCFPIVKQLLGGIMLFPESIKENVESVYPPTMPVGYGGDSTDAGSDTRMGTYNLTESGEEVNGYKHVWDFTTAQANGTIGCVCLTHRIAGNGLFNELANLYYCEGWNTSSYSASADERDNEYDRATRLFGCSQVVDFDGHRPITIGYDGEAIKIVKWNIVTTGTGVATELNTAVPFTRYEELASIEPKNGFKNNYYFVKLSDGKYHGYCHAGNKTGNAVFYTMEIDPTSWEAKEGSFEVAKKILSLSTRIGDQPNKANSSSYYYKFFSAIRGNYLYVLSYSVTEIYKINLNDTSRITTIALPFKMPDASDSNYHMRYNPVSQFIDIYTGMRQSDNKYRYGCILKDDTIAVGERNDSYSYSESNSYIFANAAGNTPFSEHLIGIADYKTWSNSGVADVSNKYIFLGYLASINNISPFTKTAAQTMKITYTITETEEVTLASIVITKFPDKTVYVAGDELNLDGMSVTAVYSDGIRKDVTEKCQSEPTEGKQLNDISLDEISIYYEEDGITRYATIPITVYELKSIAVVRPPLKTAYYSDETLDLKGTRIMAYYSDGTEKDVTSECTFTPAEGSALTAANRFVSVEYEIGLVRKIETFPISVTQVALESIEIIKPPKTTYKPRDTFAIAGIQVRAHYNNGKIKDVSSNVTSTPTNGAALNNTGTQNVTIAYSENNVTKNALLQINVTDDETALDYIEIENTPTTEYKQGDKLNTEGIKVNAHFVNSSTEDITSYCVFNPENGSALNDLGTKAILVSYTKDTVTKITSYDVEVAEKEVEIVPFSSATDEQIAAIINAIDAGKISAEDTNWKVGDEHTVHLEAMTNGGYVGETHRAQDVILVIMDTDHYDLVDRTPGGDERSHFVVGLKNSLSEAGYMNATDTNAGSWKDSKRRAWCNDTFYNAIPEILQSCFKKFKVITASAYNLEEVTTTEDMFALFAEREIFDEKTYSVQEEWDTLTQIEYYKTPGNRVKRLGTSSTYYWWERSPLSGYSSGFCLVSSSGSADSISASRTYGIAPFGCF